MRSICLLALFALGCTATASLTAQPDTVCAGRAVRLTWNGSHSGEISAEDSSLGDVAESGTKTVRPKATTTYRLHVSSLLTSVSTQTTVKVLSIPEQGTPIRGAVSDDGSGCSPGKVWVTARIPPDAWDKHLRVDLVSSADGRSYRVEHAAHTGEVTDGEPSEAFRDLPIPGAWKLETALRPGEVCGESSAPESLAVNVHFVCAD